MTNAARLFTQPGTLIGMVHLSALPGTPGAVLTPAEIVARAEREAWQLVELGFEGLLVENMGDRPYLRRSVGPEVTAVMSAACLAVRRAAPNLPLGVQVLAGANEAALGVALAAGCDFVRAEGYVFSAVADEGLLEEASAGPLLRYRKQIGAEHIAVLADLKKKHSAHAITGDVSLGETARAAEFCGADGVIVTGTATGAPTAQADVAQAAEATSLPVLVGSGTTPENAPLLLPNVAGFIVGSYLKQDGDWRRPLDAERCARLVAAVHAARG